MVTSMKPKSTGLRPTASARGITRSSGRSGRARSAVRYPFFAICIHNQGNEASLELGKAYRVIRPEENDRPSMIRVIDEEGEDYVYSADWFIPIRLPPKAKRALSTVIA